MPRPTYSPANLPGNLLRLRGEMGSTQAEVARAADVEPMSISRWERGVQAPSLDKLVQLARALGGHP